MICHRKVLCLHAAFWKGGNVSQKPPRCLLLIAPWPNSDGGPLPERHGADRTGRVGIWARMTASGVSVPRTTCSVSGCQIQHQPQKGRGRACRTRHTDPADWPGDAEVPHSPRLNFFLIASDIY